MFGSFFESKIVLFLFLGVIKNPCDLWVGGLSESWPLGGFLQLDNLPPWKLTLLGQWLNFKLFGITYLVGKIKFKHFFSGSSGWVSNMTMETPPRMKMYFLLKTGIFQPVMLVFGGCRWSLFGLTSFCVHKTSCWKKHLPKLTKL